MIRFLLRAAIVAAMFGWILDRFLASQRGGRGPDPIRSVVVIDAPIDSVWDVLADVEGQPRWMRDMKAVRVLSPGAIGVGTRAEADVRIFGMQALDPITITAFDPPRRFEIRHEGRFGGEGLIELEPGGDSTTTTVRWDESLVPPRLPHLTSALLRPILQCVFQADLANLRDLVETGSVDD